MDYSMFPIKRALVGALVYSLDRINSGLQDILHQDKFTSLDKSTTHAWYMALFYQQSAAILVEAFRDSGEHFYSYLMKDPFVKDLIELTREHMVSFYNVEDIMMPKATKLKELMDKYDINCLSIMKYDWMRHLKENKEAR